MEFALLGLIGFLFYASGGRDLVKKTYLQNSPAWTRYDADFKYYASREGINWQWLKAIAISESSLGENPLVKMGLVSSDKLSWGLMQLRQSTANDYLKGVSIAQLNDPKISIEISAKHFGRIYRKFNKNLEHAVKAYNQGEGNMAKELAARAAGSTTGWAAAQTYWTRFQNHLAQVESKP